MIRQKFLPETWKHKSNQVISFGLHIAKRGGNEYPKSPPTVIHSMLEPFQTTEIKHEGANNIGTGKTQRYSKAEQYLMLAL